MDKLKKYIEENREDFDIHEPSLDLWSKIDNQLSTNQKPKEIAFVPKRWFNWRAAASIIVLLSIGYMAGKYWRPVSESNEIISLSPKYGSEMIQYASFIDAKKNKLDSYLQSDPELMKDFQEELESLNGSFEDLKSNLPHNPNQEEILNRMIDNLEWQMQLLDQQLDIIKKKRQDEGKKVIV